MPCKNTDCMLDFGKLKWKGIFLIVYDMCLYHTNSSPSTSSYKRLEVINPSINKCWQPIHFSGPRCCFVSSQGTLGYLVAKGLWTRSGTWFFRGSFGLEMMGFSLHNHHFGVDIGRNLFLRSAMDMNLDSKYYGRISSPKMAVSCKPNMWGALLCLGNPLSVPAIGAAPACHNGSRLVALGHARVLCTATLWPCSRDQKTKCTSAVGGLQQTSPKVLQTFLDTNFMENLISPCFAKSWPRWASQICFRWSKSAFLASNPTQEQWPHYWLTYSFTHTHLHTCMYIYLQLYT